MDHYAVITDNGGGVNAVWHDVAGEEYSFPVQYKNILVPGTFVVYHRSAKKADSTIIPDRMSDGSHYFGIARIGKISATADGNFCAEILDFKKFTYPVEINRPTGGYYEINPFFQQGVRKTDKTVYDDIVAASKVPPIPAAPKAVKRKGIKSLASLAVVQRSKAFDGGKYEVVTASSGYYIYNVTDKLYYKLECPAIFKASASGLTVLSGKSGHYLVMHNGRRIGFIDPSTTGVSYKSIITPTMPAITVNM